MKLRNKFTIYSALVLFFAHCKQADADIWLCEYRDSRKRWYTSNPVNSDKQHCTHRGQIGEERFTRASFPPAGKAPPELKQRLTKSRKRADGTVGIKNPEGRGKEIFVDWRAEELKPERKRKGGFMLRAGAGFSAQSMVMDHN